MSERKGEEKWRQDGTGAPEGWLGEEKRSHTRRGKLGNHWEGRETKESVARFPLPTWAPRSLLRSWAWSSAHRGPLQPRGSWGSGREGRGRKVKAGPPGPAPLSGGCGRGGVPTPSGTHPWLGVQRRGGRPWGRCWAWRNRRERSQCFPCPLRHQEACWAPGPNPLRSEPPSCHAKPKPRPYTPTQGPTSTLGDPLWDPLQSAGPKLHPRILTQGPTSKLWNPTLQRPSFRCAASPLSLRS